MLEEDNCSDESTVAAVNSTSTSAREGIFIDSTKKNYDSQFCDFFHVSFNRESVYISICVAFDIQFCESSY